jgi:precorrin-6Y C5,15-methyltransferase (decarboxylating)
MTDIPGLVERYGKVAVLTDRQNNPAEIARIMRSIPDSSASGATMHVCERLGYADERIWSGTFGEAAGQAFRDPNVVILLRGAGSQAAGEIGKRAIGFGLREDELVHTRGLITKDEVRAVAIHKLRLPQRGVLWDIGAGSGSVSVECARMFPGLRVLAVERDDEQVGHLKSNRAAFDIRNMEIVHGSAPDALAGLPTPDRVFIGGSGGQIDNILAHLCGRMPWGIVVVNAVTLETLNQSITGLEKGTFEVSVTEIAVSRSKSVAGKRHMTAQNPIFIVTGERSRHVR